MKKTAVSEKGRKKAKPEQKPPFIIAIGASAGGLEALQEFLKHFPTGLTDFAIIVAQHLSPTYRSMLVQLLTRETSYTVKEAVHNMQLESGIVYITPPDKDITVGHYKITLTKPHLITGPKPSVDTLFISLSENHPHHSVGIILSGTGSDGAEGIKAIKDKGGITIVQEPQTAKYNGMPLAAIETGSADLVLSPDKMGEEIKEIIDNPDSIRNQPPVFVNENAQSIANIFKILSESSGTDFSNYKPSTFCRRLEKRLVKLKIKSVEDYLKYIERTPEEVTELFNSILIGVTSFFRDKEAFHALEGILKKIIATKAPNESIRIWIPGCATGEEAYSIAILLSEVLQGRTSNYNIQIFGTDIDDHAITKARKGVYSAEAVENMPEAIKMAYFIEKGDQVEVIKTIRSMVLFSRHDLTSNPPFLKLDLISCRNLLIYFGNSLQKQIIPVFHYSLVPHGYLFLGKSETVGQYTDLFSTIDGKSKVFQRKIGSAIHSIKFSSFKPNKITGVNRPPVKISLQQELTLQDIVKETIYLSYDHPYVVVNDNFDLIEINGDVHPFLKLVQGSININILKLIIPELQLELRSLLSKSQREMTSLKSPVKKLDMKGEPLFMRLLVKPVISIEKNRPFIIIFEIIDIVEFAILASDSNDLPLPDDPHVKELEQELAATKEHLQTYIEELETTNEELQSLNEELQSTNEELQSSNEELETTNEELQATNEEIQVAYTELRSANIELERKEKELQASKSNLAALLNNTLQSFILIDNSYIIISFNEMAQQTCTSHFNKKLKQGATVLDCFMHNDIELFLTNLKKAQSGEIVEFEIIAAGKGEIPDPREFKVNLTPVKNPREEVEGISLSMLDISAEKKAKHDLINAKFFVDTVFNAAGFGICVTDQYGRFVDVNDQYCNIYGYSRRELRGKSFTIVVPPKARVWAQDLHDRFIAGEEEIPAEWTVMRKDGKELTVNTYASLMIEDNGARYKVTSVVDITEVKKLQNQLQDTHLLARIGSWEYHLDDDHLEFDKLSEQVVKGLSEHPHSMHQFVELFKDTINIRTLEKAFAACKQKGIPFDLELQLAEKDGVQSWVRLVGKIKKQAGKKTMIYGYIQDITSSKAVHSDIKIFTKMFEQSPSPIIITDIQGIIEYVNPAFCRISGYTMEESIGRSPSFLRWPDANRNIYAAIWKSILDGKIWSGTLKNMQKNGEPFWVSASIAPLKNEKGETINFISIQENITDRILLEQEIKLERINNQKKITDSIIIAQEKERIEIGQELHDNINQMLASAKIFLSTIHQDDPIFLKVENILSEAINEIRRMSHTLVLPADLNTSLKDLINTIVTEFNDIGNVSIHTSFDNFNEYEIPQNMKLNLYRIFQIQLSNIFRHAEAANIWITLERKGKSIKLEIADDGKGFDPNIKTNGIGLMNLRTRAALFDGRVEVNTSPGKGCKVLAEMTL